jgi:hypothetical protein
MREWGESPEILTKDDHARERPVVVENRSGAAESATPDVNNQLSRLEEYLGPVLNHTSRVVAIKPAKTAVIHVVVRHGPLRVIPEIEELNSNLESGVLP